MDASCWSTVKQELGGDSMSSMFGNEIPQAPRAADLRRRGLTMIQIVAEQRDPLKREMIIPALFAAAYVRYVLPGMLSFGVDRWRAQVQDGHRAFYAGGIYAEVSWAWALMLSIGYISFVLLGVRVMARLPPVKRIVFEAMAVYNCSQFFLNLFVFGALIVEVRRLDFSMFGNKAEASEATLGLGSLIFLQYHSVQFQLLETFFMVARKRFMRISLLHLYLRVLNMWGWYFACRFACGGDTYFPALITSGCQTLVYLYYTLSLFGLRNMPMFKKARVTEVQIAQYFICAVHNVHATARGHLPIALTSLHLFVILNGLILYTDFDDTTTVDNIEEMPTHPRQRITSDDTRLSFSFDSCGWLYCYHFGVAACLREHLQVDSDKQLPPGVTFSGSSGGALVACVLATGVDIHSVFDTVLQQHEDCRRNPLNMFKAVEIALRHFNYKGAHKVLKQRLRVLVTRVTFMWPFVMGEVIDDFPNDEVSIDIMAASCHVPLLAGIFPKRVGGKMYYDGMAWTSALVPWRGPRGSRVVKITARSAPLHHVQSPMMPLWWAVFPPSKDVLRGMFWRGYRDMAEWFNTPPETLNTCCRRPMSRLISPTNQQQRQVSPTNQQQRQVSPTNQEPLDKPEAFAADVGAATAKAEDLDDHVEIWKAARALLTPNAKEDGGLKNSCLPQTDPFTDQSVKELMDVFHAEAKHGNQIVCRALMFIAPAFMVGTAATLQF